MKKKVLYIANTDTALNGELLMASLLNETESYILYENNLQIHQLVEKHKINLANINVIELPLIGINRKNLYERFVMGKFGRRWFCIPFSMEREGNKARCRIKEIKKIFEQINPDMLVVYTDRRGAYEQVAIKFAKERDIPIVIPPISRMFYQQFFNNKNNGIRFLKKEKLPLIYSIARRKNAQWVKEYGEEIVFFKSAQELLTAQRFNMSNSNPWQVGATEPTINARFDIDDYYDTIEVLGKEITITNLIYAKSIDEELAQKQFNKKRTIREEIKKEYGLKRDIAIVSAVPYYEASIIDRETNYYNNKMLIEAALMLDMDILVSLHPKMKYEDYLFLEKNENVRIVDEPLNMIFPCADLFIALDNSATKNLFYNTNIKTLLPPAAWFEQKIEVNTLNEYFRNWRGNSEVLTQKTAIYKLSILDLVRKILRSEDITKIIAEQNQILEGKKYETVTNI